MARRRIGPHARRSEELPEYPLPIHNILAEEGLLGLAVDDGLAPGGLPTICAAIELLAMSSSVAAFIASNAALVTRLLERSSNEDLRDLIREIAGGRRFVVPALIEGWASHDLTQVRCSAAEQGDGFALSGEKSAIPHVDLVDQLIVFARTGRPGSSGLTALVVDTRAAGVCGQPSKASALKAWPLGSVVFDDVEVPASAVLADERDGPALAAEALSHGWLFDAAHAGGMAERVMRSLHDRPGMTVAALPATVAADRHHRLEAQLAAARALTRHAADCVADRRSDGRRLAAMALVTAIEALWSAVGGTGGDGEVADHHDLARARRDARVLTRLHLPATRDPTRRGAIT